MRSPIVIALAAALAASCADSFEGTDLYFELRNLPVQRSLPEEDRLPLGSDLCADDAYFARRPPAEPLEEYDVWATIRGGPVRLARFVVRDCTTSVQDFEYKQAVTTVSYVREPRWGYPDEVAGSGWFGVVSGALTIPIGGFALRTPVRVEDATQIFITREPEGVLDEAQPSSNVLVSGLLERRGAVLFAELEKRSGNAEGVVTVVVTSRETLW